MTDHLKHFVDLRAAHESRALHHRIKMRDSARLWKLNPFQVAELNSFLDFIMDQEKLIITACLAVIVDLQGQLATAQGNAKSTDGLAAEQTAEANPLVAAKIAALQAQQSSGSTVVGGTGGDTTTNTGVSTLTGGTGGDTTVAGTGVDTTVGGAAADTGTAVVNTTLPGGAAS